MSSGQSAASEPRDEAGTTGTAGAKSMIGQETGTTRAGAAGDRAQEMRGTLKVRQEAEALLAEATQLRQRAVADADSMVAEAEKLAAELVDEARATAERVVAESQERAEGIVALARSEAEDMRRQTEREREELRAAVVGAVRADIERAHAGLQAAAPVLEGALGAVSGALTALEVVRDDDWTTPRVLQQAQPKQPTEPVGPQTVAAPADEALASASEATTITSLPEAADGNVPRSEDDGDARPLGWLFRSTQA